jgi:hypothetical protein
MKIVRDRLIPNSSVNELRERILSFIDYFNNTIPKPRFVPKLAPGNMVIGPGMVKTQGLRPPPHRLRRRPSKFR